MKMRNVTACMRAAEECFPPDVFFPSFKTPLHNNYRQEINYVVKAISSKVRLVYCLIRVG